MSDTEAQTATDASSTGDASIQPDPVLESRFAKLASDRRIETTVNALKTSGIEVILVPDRKSARETVLKLLPQGAEVLDVSSQTLVATGLAAEIQDSGRFNSIRPRLARLSEEGNVGEQRRLGAAPEYVVGSVHAVTEQGQVVVASASGSQLTPYAYGAAKVIWVVGTQKIDHDLDEAFRRIRDYTFPLEDARAKQAYGIGSSISKLLIFNREFQPGRITMVLVKENLGF